MAHRLETLIEHLLAQPAASVADVEALQGRSDALSATFDALRSRDAQAYAEAEDSMHAALSEPEPVAAPPLAPVLLPVAVALPPIQVEQPVVVPATPAPSAPALVAAAPQSPAAAAPAPGLARDIDWSRFAATDGDAPVQAAADRNLGASNAAVRVRGVLLERLVNQAGEVSITRSRIESEVGNIRGSLGDLTDNLERLRVQLRDIEFQAETQMISRQEAAKQAHEAFDPLESDRFTRFQELTRMMAESVNDVATVQRTLTRTLETTEDELAAQARLTRDLQDDLLRTRMVEFESTSDRLYRVVRQAAKETGKQVRLDIVGGSIEIDRGVLDRMTPAFEHLLRNCVTHGIESPDVRTAAGKDPIGSIVVALHQEGNEVGVEFRDDGAGLNLQRIRDKGLAMGLIQAGEDHGAGDLANLIFTPGFSTAETVTELSGRGVGMDVVRSEVNAMGGRIETATAAGKGTSFKLVLPLTTAVTQVVMVRCGSTVVALPATLIEIVRRASAKELDDAYASGAYPLGERSLLFFWFGSLLQEGPRSQEVVGRTRPIIVVRSAQQRIALHVDEVLGTQEVVVKNLGPQLSRLPGLAGMTLLASGAVALIYNPVALATLYGESARAATVAALRSPNLPAVPTAEETAAQAAPLVLVVDDSLTVRRVTQRLLVREGYRVILAKDGIEALERLAEDLPQVVLSDIEMPRMDGFDLVRNIRGDARLRALPVIMITSRIAQKHRDYAAELGVDHYLGKPYSEEDLLALIGRYTAAPAQV
jgi:chemosensory pili system protein ChpA (sensor histidine kinase/response regulator)